MATLPAATDFTGAAITEAQFKTAITDLRTFLADQLGTAGTVAAALTALGALAGQYEAKTGAYTVLAADRGKAIGCSGTFSLTLTAAATLGSGFSFAVINYGSGTVTIDPNSTEQIDGATTIALAANESCIVVCTGTAWRTIGKSSTLATASNNGLMSSTYAAKLDGIEAGANVGVDTDVGTDAIGVFALCRNNTASTTVASNGTTAGTNLDYMYFDVSGTLADTGTTPSGTWRNISGTGNLAGQTCMWQRVS